IALEHHRPPVVHDNGDGDDERLLALLQHVDEVRIDRKRFRYPAQLLLRDLVRVLAEVRDGGFDRGHMNSFCRANRAFCARPGGAYLIVKAIVRTAAPLLSVGYAISLSAYSPAGRVAPVGSRPVTPYEYRPGSTSRMRASRPMRPPLRLHSSRSSCCNACTSCPASERGTAPATKLSSAGFVSDGLNERDDRWTLLRAALGCGPNVITQGMRIAFPAVGRTTSAPCNGASPSTALVTRTLTWKLSVRPGPRKNSFGRIVNSTAAAPSRATSTSRERRSLRTDTLCSWICCVVRQ